MHSDGFVIGSPPALLWRRGFAHLVSYPWLADARLIHARPRSVRLSFTAGKHLSIYEACRLISGRPPEPFGMEDYVPCMALISGGADKPGYHHQRPHARRGREAFLAIKGAVVARTISSDRAYLSPPTATSGGVVDWLNTKVRTSDVVALCKEKGWRIRFDYPRPAKAVAPIAPVDIVPLTVPPSSASVRRRFSHLDRPTVIDYLKTCPCQNCDKAVALAEEALGIDIGQTRGRKLWKEAGRYTPRGKRPRPLACGTHDPAFRT